MPQEPLERLFMWGENGRVLRNEELYRDLLRAGIVLRPGTTVASDREWRHGDGHYDGWEHSDWTSDHLDSMYHADQPGWHHDDRPQHHDGNLPPHGDSLPPGGHGDRTGSHLDRTEQHIDAWWHFDQPPQHYDRTEHQDHHSDTPFEGHWDEKGPKPPNDHIDA